MVSNDSFSTVTDNSKGFFFCSPLVMSLKLHAVGSDIQRFAFESLHESCMQFLVLI